MRVVLLCFVLGPFDGFMTHPSRYYEFCTNELKKRKKKKRKTGCLLHVAVLSLNNCLASHANKAASSLCLTVVDVW